MSICYLLLGTNQGDKHQNLETAARMISDQIGEILTESSIYVTAAWGIEDQDEFLNQVLKVESSLSVEDLMDACLLIEKVMGRIRQVKWGARLIDIDILYYGDQIYKSNKVTVPHPAIPDRRFTLVPLLEITRNYVHPVLKKTHDVLLAECKDKLEVKKHTG